MRSPQNFTIFKLSRGSQRIRTATVNLVSAVIHRCPGLLLRAEIQEIPVSKPRTLFPRVTTISRICSGDRILSHLTSWTRTLQSSCWGLHGMIWKGKENARTSIYGL
jgi:hypothetical protein